MVVRSAQELRQLQTNRYLAGSVEEYLSRAIDLRQALRCVHEKHAFVHEIVLCLQQISVSHDALKIVNILNGCTEDLTERHEYVILNTLQII